MRITITGPSGAGKTCLARSLAEKLSLPFIEEIARELCKKAGFERIGEIPDQELFKKEVLLTQILREKELDSFIADRGALDCWILWQRWNICSAMTYDTEFIYESVKSHMQNYNYIIYIPPLFQPSEDNFRWTEPDYIKQIDRITRMSIQELDLKDRLITITALEHNDRISQVLNFLK